MKQVFKLITILAIMVFATSCGNNTEKKEKTTVKEEITEVKQPETEHHEEGSPVILNNGEKWLANPETTDGIKKMQLLMGTISNRESTDSYVELKVKLEAEFSDIFAKCTMKGEAHNQLHNYLKPMLGLFEEFESSDLERCKKSYETMNKHLSHYKNYFE